MSKTIRMAIVGLGKIAKDQHIPAIAASPSFELAATVSRGNTTLADIPHFHSMEELFNSKIEVDAVALCMPPQARRKFAHLAIAQGLHVFMEKPPATTLSEVEILKDHASANGVSLLASWHSRYAAGVNNAKSWLTKKTIESVKITWREDVRIWHPGQKWIWQPGGFGVFDPGINALSIATWILPNPFYVKTAELFVPENCFAPIAAKVHFLDVNDNPVKLDLDFRQEGPQTWDIQVTTSEDNLLLSHGGENLSISGQRQDPDTDENIGEYPSLYRHFAHLIGLGISDVDVSPLRVVADVFLNGKITMVEPFYE